MAPDGSAPPVAEMPIYNIPQVMHSDNYPSLREMGAKVADLPGVSEKRLFALLFLLC